jgi:DNA-binding response OmpR family regulator
VSEILVIDDNDAVARAVASALQMAGHRVRIAADGKKAELLAHEYKFDLVITDIVMPEKEGIETIMGFRAKFPYTKIMAMSGAGRSNEYLRFAKRLGAIATLQKPFEREQLLETVRTVLELRND